MRYFVTTSISWDRATYMNRWAAQDGCGAVTSFVGVVRADQVGPRTVKALFYDAYPEMGEALMQRLIDAAHAQWSLDRMAVQHRLGLVEVGQISVVIAVAAQHRAQAYAASQFLVERIKHDVPIWKREHYEDGTSRWVTEQPELLDVADPAGATHADV